MGDSALSSVVWILVVGSAIWVAFDSRNLGAKAGVLGGGMADMGPVGWFLVVLLLWIVGFPAYLATRPRYVALKAGGAVVPPPPPSANPAGWYPDPSKRHELRYWDGLAWTANVSDAGVPSSDAL